MPVEAVTTPPFLCSISNESGEPLEDDLGLGVSDDQACTGNCSCTRDYVLHVECLVPGWAPLQQPK